mmetsp:Transcript_77321/g.167197  ORF Transcript_77321/g.167197 Transcript_77321/m.167197 type:complete len:152 (+) Transcript_77321:122-577(+)
MTTNKNSTANSHATDARDLSALGLMKFKQAPAAEQGKVCVNTLCTYNQLTNNGKTFYDYQAQKVDYHNLIDMNVDNLTQGLLASGKDIEGYYAKAKLFASAAEAKTASAQELSSKLKAAVEAAEDARTAYFDQLSEARAILAKLHEQTTVQ